MARDHREVAGAGEGKAIVNAALCNVVRSGSSDRLMIGVCPGQRGNQLISQMSYFLYRSFTPPQRTIIPNSRRLLNAPVLVG
jgi:hypothetical protein